MIKNIFTDFLIYMLRKMRVSVIIGVNISNGTVKAKTSRTYIFDNDFDMTEFRTLNNTNVTIPNDPFEITA